LVGVSGNAATKARTRIVNTSAPCRTPTGDQRPPPKKDCLLDHVQLVRQFHLKLFCLLRVADWVMSASFLLSHTLPRRIHLSSGISGRICSTVREHPKNTTILSGEWFYPESCRIWARRERSRPWYSRLGQLSGHIMSASYELSVALANPRYTA
jgi:hypothetical protein